MNWTYTPTQVDLIYCMEVSKFRDSMNRNKNRAPMYVGASICDGFVGALGELAISELTGIKWTGATLEEADWQLYRKTNADLGPFEVKTISSAGGTLNLGNSDKDWAIGVLVLAPEARSLAPLLYSGKDLQNPIIIKALGYLPVSCKQIGYKSETRFDSGFTKVNYAVAQKKLKPMADLNPLVASLKSKRGTIVSHIKNVPPFEMADK